MADVEPILDHCLAELRSTVEAASRFVTGLFNLAFLVPSLAFVGFALELLHVHAWLSKTPNLFKLPVRMKGTN